MIRLQTTLLTLLSLSVLSQAQAQQKADTPDRVAQFWKKFATARTISYTLKLWEPNFWLPTPAGQSILLVRNTYEIKAQRPNRISINTSPGIEREMTENGLVQRQYYFDFPGNYINDGKASILCLSLLRVYWTGSGMTRLGNDENDNAPNIGARWIFGENPMEACRLLPESIAQSVEFVVYSKTDSKTPKSELRLYFDKKTGDLSRRSRFSRNPNGEWKEYDRSEFNFWEFNIRLPRDTFNVRPPRNYMSQEAYDKLYNIKGGDTKAK